MPVTIEFKDSLAFTKAEALGALLAEVSRQQQAVRKQMKDTLRAAATNMTNESVLPDADVAAAIVTLRDQLTALRQEFIRLGRVREDLAAQRGAAP